MAELGELLAPVLMYFQKPGRYLGRGQGSSHLAFQVLLPLPFQVPSVWRGELSSHRARRIGSEQEGF